MKSLTYDIRFVHNSGKRDDMPVGTKCVVLDAKTKEPLTVCLIKLYYKDQFSRSKGRKISLACALKKLGLTKRQRRIVWNDYLKRFKK